MLRAVTALLWTTFWAACAVHCGLFFIGLSFFCACAFAGVEYTWTGSTHVDEGGNVRVVGLWKGRKPHTSWGQFWGSAILFTPLLSLIDTVPLCAPRIALWPMITFAFEIVWGYYLWHVWRTRAWEYRGRWAKFDGNIHIGYTIWWALLGVAYEIAKALANWIMRGAQ